MCKINTRTEKSAYIVFCGSRVFPAHFDTNQVRRFHDQFNFWPFADCCGCCIDINTVFAGRRRVRAAERANMRVCSKTNFY